jgi:hypothetical protein
MVDTVAVAPPWTMAAAAVAAVDIPVERLEIVMPDQEVVADHLMVASIRSTRPAYSQATEWLSSPGIDTIAI